MGILAIIILGLVAGLLARAIVPGRQGMGILATVALGIVGSFVGGFLGTLFYSHGNFAEFQPTGLIFSTLGAIVILVVVNAASAGSRRGA